MLGVGAARFPPVEDHALSWAQSVLGAEIAQAVVLPGGLTSTMIALADTTGRQSVLRLMTNEPWRAYGAELTLRERAAQQHLSDSPVPAPTSIAIDPDGHHTAVAAHLMSRLPGMPTTKLGDTNVKQMARMLATIHEQRPAKPFREYQSWAAEAKWVVPVWSRHPDAWRHAFAVLSGDRPGYDPTFLHRDYSHRNIIWLDGQISGVVDWVETSTGPAWLDAGHAATNLAMGFGTESAWAFLSAFAAETTCKYDPYWLFMDAVGFLAPPGSEPLFGSAAQLDKLDSWVHELVTQPRLSFGRASTRPR